jgi:hypothetical protein
MKSLRPLLAYLPWHARDAVVRALVPPLIFVLVAVGPLWAFAKQNQHLRYDDGGSGEAFAMTIYSSFVQLAITLGVIAMMTQLVSLDRERQFVRFLFAHQVTPWQYYLQRFVVSLTVFLVVFATIPLGYSYFVTAVPLWPALQSALLYGGLLGGLAMLCGALVQRDGIALVGVMLAGTVLQQADRAGTLPSVLGFISDILPPFDKAGLVRNAWIGGRAVDGGDLLLVVAYSIAMLAVALVAVKRLPLVR